MHLQGKVALVTGAASGIGAAAAKKLAAHGAHIAALDISNEALEELVPQIQSNGAETLPLVADIGDPKAVQEAISQIETQWGRLDIVFANAGINGVWAPLDELEPEEWDKTIRNNLTGTFLTIKYAAPLLKRQGGAVVVTASVNGTRIFSNTGATAYSTSKAGQVALTKMLALELAPHKVRINVICPGAIETNIDQSTEQRDVDKVKIPVEFPESNQPLTGGAPGCAEQVADLVVFLVSDAAGHITGTEMWIDGAESLLMG